MKWLQIDFLHRSDFSLVKLCDFGSVRPAGDIVIKKVFHCFPPHSWIVSSRSINAIQSLQKNLSIFEFILEWAASVLSRRTRGPPCKWILPGMTLYHDYYEFWSSWLLWSFGLFWVYLHVKLSCARWDYLWWLFILISIIIMIIMWNSGGSSARCLPVWNCCLLLSPGDIDDCDDWSSSLYDQGILPWQKADLTDPYFSEFCSWRSKRNGKVIFRSRSWYRLRMRVVQKMRNMVL